MLMSNNKDWYIIPSDCVKPIDNISFAEQGKVKSGDFFSDFSRKKLLIYNLAGGRGDSSQATSATGQKMHVDML